jgi:OHCU decarboxylase
MNRTEFMSVFGGLYEYSPWIAEAVFEAGLDRTHDQADGLHKAFCEEIESAGKRQQLDLLRAHPDLAGKLARSDELTAESRSEQAGAGLDQCTAEEFSRFTQLNERYEARFGFPFIMAVKGADRAQILSQFQIRVDNSVEAEFDTALRQVLKIGWFRIKDIFNE